MLRCSIAEYLSQDMVVAIDQVYNVLDGVEVKSLRVGVSRCTEVQDSPGMPATSRAISFSLSDLKEPLSSHF